MDIDKSFETETLHKPNVRCDSCRIGHRRCEGTRPTCKLCLVTGKECSYQQADTLNSPSVFGCSRAGSIILTPSRRSLRLSTTSNPHIKRRSEEAVQDGPRKYPKLAISRSKSAMPLRSKVKKPRTIDAAKDNGEITSNNGFENYMEEAVMANGPSVSPSATSSIQDDYFSVRSPQRRDYRKVSAIPASPTRSIEGREEPDSINGGSLIFAELKEAILHRTDTSRPGFSKLTQHELQRLSAFVKNNKGPMRSLPDPEDLVLPSSEVAEDLIKFYFTREHLNLPIIDHSAFCIQYVDMWAGEIPMQDLGIFQGLVNAVFAIGCISTNPANKTDASMYFARAQKLIRFGNLEGEDLTRVQAYLICSQYLLAIGKLESAWKSVGIAIRTAQSLHFHLKSGSQHLEKKADRELVRRVWYSCVVLEKIIAMNRGISLVPTTLSQAPLPIPLNRDYFIFRCANEPIPDEELPSIVGSFAVLCRLYETYETVVSIQDDLRVAKGRSPRQVLKAFDAQKLLHADRMLASWNAALPPSLHPSSPVPRHSIARRQRHILRIQYLHMCLLLWRPLLAILAADPSICQPRLVDGSAHSKRDRIDKPLIHTVANESAIKCILAAREIIDILTEHGMHDERIEHDGPVPSWWDSIGYVFSCATVMLAARLCPSAYNELPENTVELGWDHSIAILANHRDASPLATEGLMTLKDLASAVMDMEDDESQAVRDLTWLEALPADLER